MSAPDLRRSPSHRRLTGACALTGAIAGAALAFAGPGSMEIAGLSALGLLAGAGAGIALGTLRRPAAAELAGLVEDRTIRTEAQLLLTAGPPVLGVIPEDASAASQPVLSGMDSRTPRAEALRHLRTNLQFMNTDNPPQAITVTSTLPREGRTTVAVNLAVTLAQNGRKVLLVDADLRNPDIHHVLGLDGSRGLSDILIDDVLLEDVQQSYGEDGLHVLTAGTIPANPSELLGSRQMLTLLHTLDQVFDHIVLDAPPLLAVTDAAVLSKITDGILVVVKAGAVLPEELERAVGRVTQINGRMLGTVLTHAEDTGYHLPQTVPSASRCVPSRSVPSQRVDDPFPHPMTGTTSGSRPPEPDTMDLPVITITSLGASPPR